MRRAPAAPSDAIDLLLAEGMQVRIMELDGGLDPDEYCKERGAEAYQERLDRAKGYFYWLADRRAQTVRHAHVRREDFGTAVPVAGGAENLRPVGADDCRQRCGRLHRRGARHCAGYVPSQRVGRSDNLVTLPKSAMRADERGLVNVILSGAEGCDQLLEELSEIELRYA